MKPLDQTGRAHPLAKRAGRVVLLLAGVALIAWIFRTIGWPAIESNLSVVGLWFVPLAALYLFAQLSIVLGWRAVIDPQPRLSSLPDLFAVYLAGDAVNYLAPGGVAGEPVKVHLLREKVGIARVLASLTIHKHAELLAQCVFVWLGVAVSLSHFRLPLAAQAAALAGVAALTGLLALMTWALFRGTYSPILRRLSGWGSARASRYQLAAQALDVRIREFYGWERRRFFAAAGWCFLGWCGGLLETYLILRLLSPLRGLPTAFAIEALTMVCNTVLLFVPGRVGSAEGVRVGVFVLLGLPAAQGVAYGLVRRARELVWVLPGFLILLKRQVGGLRRVRLPEMANLPSEELQL